jgi:hypothetical protein
MITSQDELWKPVVGYEGLYEISSTGRILAPERLIVPKAGPQYMKPSKNIKTQVSNSGYCCVLLLKEGKYRNLFVHRLVANAFISNENKKPQVNHIDGNKQNNHVLNLEWNTPRENQKHAEAIGLKNYSYNSGSNNIFAKINQEKADLMRKLRKEGLSYRKIATHTETSASTVEHFLKGLRYKGLYGNN